MGHIEVKFDLIMDFDSLVKDDRMTKWNENVEFLPFFDKRSNVHKRIDKMRNFYNDDSYEQ